MEDLKQPAIETTLPAVHQDSSSENQASARLNKMTKYFSQALKSVLLSSPSGLKLTPKADLAVVFFCMGATEGNQLQSYDKAFGTNSTAGTLSSRLFRKVTTRSRVAEIKAALYETAKMQPAIAGEEEILVNLTKISRLDVKEYAEWGSSPASEVVEKILDMINNVGSQKPDEKDYYQREKLVELLDQVAASGNPFVAYSRLKNSAEVDGTQVKGLKMTREGLQISFHDKVKALELLAKSKGLLGDTPTKDVSDITKLPAAELLAVADLLKQEMRQIKVLEAGFRKQQEERDRESIPPVGEAD